jgi:hypothetical protein
MAFRNTPDAESWSKIYEAFSQINFTSYDYDTIKASLIDYLRIYWPESFNDLIESSELIALLEMFAYVAEQLAYRVDMVSHENFISTAQRKQSILRLAKLISYKSTRNVPVRGLVKFTSITTTERIIDSRGVDLSGLTVNWNDPNNSNWKEQFTTIINRVMTSRLGLPQKSFQVGDVVMDLYSLNATPASTKNGVHAFSVQTGLDRYSMELVPVDLDVNGPYEREPDVNGNMSIIFANDGIGDSSEYTGFLGYVKQGTLIRIDYAINDQLPNRKIDFLPDNINHTDVWVQKLDTNGVVAERWKQVDTISEQNIIFNGDKSTRLKYEVDSLENDQISIVFGDGDFAESPVGQFRFWMRQSANRNVVIPKSKLVNETFSFTYVSANGTTETCTLTFSLTSTMQNGSASETIEHIRQSAPSTYYSQNRMVNGQDYNTYMLKDPSILRLKTINRTFAGQPKYIDWNDASGSYENVKLFGDDLSMRYDLSLNSLTTTVSGQALIDNVIEPLLNDSGIITALTYLSATHPATTGVISSPRRTFIEDNRAGLHYSTANSLISLIAGSTGDGSLKEKTAIQGLIDRHWYGEPLEYIKGDGLQVWAKIPDPALNPKDDSKIYAATVPRTIDGINKYPPGDVGSGFQPIAEQDYFALKYHRTSLGIGTGSIVVHNRPTAGSDFDGEVWTIEIGADSKTIYVRSSLRGTFPTGVVGEVYEITPAGQIAPIDFFTISQLPTDIVFEPGDAFILDTPTNAAPTVRNIAPYFNTSSVINLNGWWELLTTGANDLGAEFANGPTSAAPYFHDQVYDPFGDRKNSWLIFVKKIKQQPTNVVIGYEVFYRSLKLLVESPTTKFWFNEVDQILDSDTKKRVFDNIKVLRSNKDWAGNVIKSTQLYDVIGAVKKSTGENDINKLHIVPSDLLQEDTSGNLEPDRLLQFINFAGLNAAESFEYFDLENQAVILAGTSKSAAVNAFSSKSISAFGVVASSNPVQAYGRRLSAANRTDAAAKGLDFMWQHFAPNTNIIDPSVTNIHDCYILTEGYYSSVINFVRGISSITPIEPTSLDLRNSYSYLLKNKMLSDTLVLHSGKIKLLFGALAEPQLRAKFRIVRSPGSRLTNEKIKEELLNVINSYFEISNWDFGESFYATELIALMHQKLPTEISSAVLVPLYSTNSFGDMFTVDCGENELLQSAAMISDIEIVDALTPTTLRQIK